MVDVREVDFVVNLQNCEKFCHGIKVFNTKTNIGYCIDLHNPIPHFEFKVIKQYQTINLRDDR